MTAVPLYGKCSYVAWNVTSWFALIQQASCRSWLDSCCAHKDDLGLYAHASDITVDFCAESFVFQFAIQKFKD